MKKTLTVLIFLLCAKFAFSSHISGGEMYYTYLGKSLSDPTKLSYKITLLLYKDTTVTGQTVANLSAAYNISIYRGDNNALIGNFAASRISYDFLKLSYYNPCLSNRPRVEFSVAAYEFTIDLPPLAEGYFASHSQCCRVSGVVNMNSNVIGATYWVKIPGTIENSFFPNNSNAYFLKRDTILVCKSSPVKLDFSAIDPDGDQLVYKFGPGYVGAGAPPNQLPAQSDIPPYKTVDYLPGYTFSQPFGNTLTNINPNTGLVSGIAPDITGIYLIAVLVEEFRNGQKISEHRKEFQIKVEDCSLTGAALKPSYITCDGFTLSFENQSTSSNITSYLWDFGDKTPATSTNPTPTHTYSDTGTYVLKLKVTSNGGCQDSTTAPVQIYPGFKADFTVQGTCYLNTYKFFDATVSKYGSVNSWKWNFGDSTTIADTASTKDSAWKYASARTAQVRLITTNSKGCIDTITRPVNILDRPSLGLSFRDTLICSNDTLVLRANITSGSVVWTPMNGPNKTRILNTTSLTPLVFPRDTTRYYVSVNDNGCTNSDSVNVNVLQFISVDAGLDSVICRTDTFRLSPESEALSYQWTASTGETVQNSKYPLVNPLVNTKYHVIANLGKCQARDSVLIKVAPYPNAALGADMTICFGSRTQLNGSVTGSVFYWNPTSSLINENTLTPTAGPVRTTTYVLTATDTSGCPKAHSDTIVVTVIPTVTAYAGRDTAVLPGQPLQLSASGGSSYTWSPAIGLNDPSIANPIAILNTNMDSITYTVRVSAQNGCYSDDQLTVRVYKSSADIIVPSAFTPNGDGKNDITKPLTVGITKLVYFSIYNRWGQLLFTTTEIGKGWDGNFNGVSQPSGTYVYQALGADYLGITVYRKGTVVLIR